VKLKSCKVCSARFEPHQPLQVVCGPVCALTHGRRSVLSRQRSDLKRRREALLSLSDHHKATQAIFNKYIRLRDSREPCISCRTTKGQRHASHYRPTGPNPGLRYEELNCHASCAQCNLYHSGRLTQYRINLIEKIGEDMVKWLEGPHEQKQYRVEDLKEIQRHYKAEIKHLEARCTVTN
jgi:Bacteriophage Lambda NinG protein